MSRLRPRIIPCLLIRDKGLVKTVRFKEGKYIGDPMNAVRIFDEKEVDELIVLDIDATCSKRPPDLKLIQNIAAECRMPLCYGGGVRTVEQARKIIGLGVEKVAISSAAVENPSLVSDIASELGSQSVVVVLDTRMQSVGSRWSVFTHNGTRDTGMSPIDLARKVESFGAGEIVINAIDRDGLMSGYDLNLAARVREAVNLPLTILGGAGSLEDIADLLHHLGVVGAAAGSLFVFKGSFKAVLINYPTQAERDCLGTAVLYPKSAG